MYSAPYQKLKIHQIGISGIPTTVIKMTPETTTLAHATIFLSNCASAMTSPVTLAMTCLQIAAFRYVLNSVAAEEIEAPPH